MKVIITDLASNSIINIFDYNSIYSYKAAIEIDNKINKYISILEHMPYIGKQVPEIRDKHYRQIICRSNQDSYKIIYYLSESMNTIYIRYVINSRKNFERALKKYNYFKNSFLN